MMLLLTFGLARSARRKDAIGGGKPKLRFTYTSALTIRLPPPPDLHEHDRHEAFWLKFFSPTSSFGSMVSSKYKGIAGNIMKTIPSSVNHLRLAVSKVPREEPGVLQRVQFPTQRRKIPRASLRPKGPKTSEREEAKRGGNNQNRDS